MKKTIEINDYDYRKMIKDFEISERFLCNKKKLKKKYHQENKKYQLSIEHMKELREENYLKKSEDLITKLNNKENLLITSLENNSIKKQKKNQKILDAMTQKEKAAKENVVKFLEQQEKMRVDFQKITNLKLENFKERHLRKREDNKLKYKKFLTNQEIRHEHNIMRLNLENEKINKKNNEKNFKKYVSFFWQRKAKEKRLKQKKEQIYNKLQEKNEKIMLLEQLNDKRRKGILRKIKSMDLRKKQKEQNKLKKILDSKTKREQRFSSCIERRKEFMEVESERRKEILYFQSQIFLRSLSKDNIVTMKRKNAYEKISKEQLILEKNLMAFNKEMNTLKSQSVNKKTFEEKLKMFKEVKKQEELRKKEMEDNIN